MKPHIMIVILMRASCFAQDSIPFSGYYFTDNELNRCLKSKNQLYCLDSLIRVTMEVPKPSGSVNYQKARSNRFRKLFLYHLNAGYVSGSRGNIVQSFSYVDVSEQYLDTLNQSGKAGEFKDFKETIRYLKTELCIKTYRKDTAAFNRCYCMQFFPEMKDEPVVTDTAAPPNKKQIPPVTFPDWGEFYIRDTLRINNHFVSDSASIYYFRKLLQPLILAKLSQNPYYYEMLGDPSINLQRDTLIYRLSAKYEKGQYERTCKLVFTSSQHPAMFDYFLLLLSNIEFPGFLPDLEIYIPIVVTSENAIHTNKAGIQDDHFLIEAIKHKSIKPDR